jgi:hypothetical protein
MSPHGGLQRLIFLRRPNTAHRSAAQLGHAPTNPFPLRRRSSARSLRPLDCCTRHKQLAVTQLFTLLRTLC